MTMQTKEAVGIAKKWVADQLSGEGVQDIGLEEVRFSDGSWQITVGFSRPWDQTALSILSAGRPASRTYKVVVISDETKEVTEMRNREAA